MCAMQLQQYRLSDTEYVQVTLPKTAQTRSICTGFGKQNYRAFQGLSSTICFLFKYLMIGFLKHHHRKQIDFYNLTNYCMHVNCWTEFRLGTERKTA